MIQIPQNGRTEDERLSDFLLLLYMIGTHHNQSRRYLGITKADKFVFLAEKRMIDNRLKGFDYDFYRWNFGPLSPSIYADIETLQKTSMVTRGANIQLTERGRKTLEDCGSLFETNQVVVACVDEVVHRFATKTTEQVSSYVYEVEIEYPMGSKKIRDIPKGWELLKKLPAQNATQRFDIPESWRETLEVLLDTEYANRLDKALTQPSAAGAHPFGGAD